MARLACKNSHKKDGRRVRQLMFNVSYPLPPLRRFRIRYWEYCTVNKNYRSLQIGDFKDSGNAFVI